ncbi:GDYXXLXY domain-containing protein [Hymenobacter lapidiphilus]|uniref:GDYXXLXY domain-containing protein n=1 Tax=Hymenobacter lapidiphilus TaxID=2608003 RepID=A0A7Y7U6K9_9BACT|nr:GDYXXLXY domain-containing protein [Hymenobacter lapidiphilus]NVO32638.1 GDYXXLXY domain-containing protein [Hymenobacter lapidiphilus]
MTESIGSTLSPVPAAEPALLASHRRWLLWLVAAQVLFVLGVAVAGYATAALGRIITLQTEPVDPRDLLYGDHLRLRYQISELPGSLWRGPTLPRRKDAAYVLLEPAGNDYTAVGIYPEAPVITGQQVVLRGSVQDVWRRGLRLRYGLERYYVPETMTRQMRQRRRLRVQISIAPWGQARITQVDTLGVVR